MIKVGCCGFAAARKKYYASFDVVEVQQTFYQPPRTSTAERWRAEAPEGFEFALKAWQLITHEAKSPTYRRLRLDLTEKEKAECGGFRTGSVCMNAWETTAEIARILRARVIVFQCPASFRDEPANRKRMADFFSRVNRERFIFAWEPRGPWKDENVKALCRDLTLVHCVDPFKADPLAGRIAYFRLHGKTGYGYRYTTRDLAELSAKCAARAHAYCMFNNVFMFDDARRFRRLVAGP